MLHIDGSEHEWLALCPGEKQTMVDIIDDATSRILYAQLWPAESIEAVMNALKEVMPQARHYATRDGGEETGQESTLTKPRNCPTIGDQLISDGQQGGDEIRTVVKTIVALAHDMDKEIIAEGIETAEQLQYLREISCEFGQGFLFSRPLPLAEAEELLARGQTW